MALPPIAKKIPYTFKIHGETLIDNYAWLRDKNWPNITDKEILDHLNTENNYFKNVMAKYEDLEESLYEELKGRIKLADSTYPIKRGEYYYYSKTTEHSSYPIYCRTKDISLGLEEVILDCNELGTDYTYLNIGSIALSSDETKLAYSIDNIGSERYTVYIKDLKNDILLNDKIEGILGNIVWHRKRNGFFYTKLNDFWRTNKVYYHELGTESEQDKLIFSEKNITFEVNIDESQSEQFLIINSSSTNCNENWIIDFDSKVLEPILIQPRRQNHLYFLEHRGDYFYIKTNIDNEDFDLIFTPINLCDLKNWRKVAELPAGCYLTDIFTYESHIVIQFQQKSQSILRVYDYNFKNYHDINFPDPAYNVVPIFTTFTANSVRFLYSSLNTNETIMENEFLNNNSLVLKITQINGEYDKDNYVSKKLFAISEDGSEIPISLVYRKDKFKSDGTNPMYLYGYGSYGYPICAKFRPEIITLLDRGFIYAIAHIRGGNEMGRKWYLDGKLLSKKNTFNDFITSVKYLIQNNYTSEKNIVAIGCSAGGLLIGHCANENPSFFKMIVADVPYVDILNTMLDENLPLTPGEYSEFGNPSKEEKFYHYIKSYSPYDNIKKQDYPIMYVTAGLNDPRVTYWEPAKWVAKLREFKTDNNLLVFKTNMEAGHRGASGRFKNLKNIAQEYAFIIKTFET